MRTRTNLIPKTKMDVDANISGGNLTPGVFITIKDMILPNPEANDSTFSTLESLNAVWKLKVVARNSSNYEIPEIGYYHSLIIITRLTLIFIRNSRMCYPMESFCQQQLHASNDFDVF